MRSAWMTSLVVLVASAGTGFAGNVAWPGPEASNAAIPGHDWAAQESPYRSVVRGQDGSVEPLVTDRPDFTEASSVVGRGVVQLETGYTFVYNDSEDDGSITRTHSPDFLWRIGVHDLVELRLGWFYEWDRITAPGGAVTTPDGSNDLYVGAKLYLREPDDWIPEQAVILQGTVPTGSRSRSTEKVEVGVNYLYSWELPCDFSIAGSTGFDTQHEGADGSTVWHQSAALSIPILDALSGYVEYFGLYTDQSTDDRPTHFVNGGFAYLLTDDMQVDVRVGTGLGDRSDDLFTGVGLSVRR